MAFLILLARCPSKPNEAKVVSLGPVANQARFTILDSGACSPLP